MIAKPTLIDFAILGLIHQKPKTGYAIRKVFEETALGNYSSSPGTIYPALNRLQKLELTIKSNISASNKFHFEITKNGKLELIKWLSQPLQKIDVEKKIDELILRFAFMDSLLDLHQKINFLTSFKDLLSTYIKDLQSFHKAEFDKFPLHGRLAFEYGIASYKTTFNWSKTALKQITK